MDWVLWCGPLASWKLIAGRRSAIPTFRREWPRSAIACTDTLAVMALRAFPVVYAPDVEVLREAEDMPWGERIATVADPVGNPVALCQEK
jgi:hypothetical protein